MSEEVYYMEEWFTGHVQGVGFRYRALQMAKEFDVSGEVRNLPDGRVYLQVEGIEEEVEAYRCEVEKQLLGFIKDSEIKSSMHERKFEGFRITG